MSGKTFGKIQLKNTPERVKTNEGLYDQLVKKVDYIVIGKNQSYIPCVPVQNFSVINKDLPTILKNIRYLQAHTLGGKLDDNAWRLSHGNDMDFLPEFNLKNKVFPNTREKFRSTESHKMQQFQEYDVSKLLEGDASKEVSDIGAMRIIVDECFQHVYFTIEHYRPTVQGKLTKAQRLGTQAIDAWNPYIFVLFEPPPPENLKPIGSKEKSKGTPSATDKMFVETNIIEVKTSNKVTMAEFNGSKVTVIYPAIQRRGRSNSFQIPPLPEPEPIPPTPLEATAIAARLPPGGVEHAAMVLGISPTAKPNPEEWNRIKMFMQQHYGVTARQ